VRETKARSLEEDGWRRMEDVGIRFVSILCVRTVLCLLAR
jgi:hypothetical protein